MAARIPEVRKQMKCEHDCAQYLGIQEEDLGMLTGFTSRAFAALAHLREAWLSADPDNRRAIEAGLVALMFGHSFADNVDLIAQVLSARMDPGHADELCAVVGKPILAALVALREKGVRP
jgi:hypothetical protein